MVSTKAFQSTYFFCWFSCSGHASPTIYIALFHLSVYKAHTTHNSWLRADEELTLETSAFESLYRGQFIYARYLVKNRVSITQWKHKTSTSCWCNDGASQENLHFDDQSKEVASSFSIAVFSKGNRKHVLHVSIDL